MLDKGLHLIPHQYCQLASSILVSFYLRKRLLVSIEHEQAGQWQKFLKLAFEIGAGRGQKQLELIAHEDIVHLHTVIQEICKVFDPFVYDFQGVAA